MPKERRTRTVSFEARSRASPFPCSGSSRRHTGSSSQNPQDFPPATAKDMKEWDEVRCAVCMEHPHNAVLLVCSSADKGCQPFMCDTSYRHSNCLDQYKKAFNGSSSSEENVIDQEKSKLSCPLCRGGVSGWKVVDTARQYMNSKIRSCSKESCGFNGSYGELRKHARKEHPSTRPSEADPERQRDWRRMEQRRDLADLFSSMQSAMGREDEGLGDFFEDGEEQGTGMRSIFHVSSMAVLFIVSFSSSGAGRGRTSSRSSSSRGLPSRVSARRRRGRGGTLWGENHEVHPDNMDVGSGTADEADDDQDDDDGDDWSGEAGSEDAGGSNAAGSDSAPGGGRGRARHQLRVPDNETDDDNDDGELL